MVDRTWIILAIPISPGECAKLGLHLPVTAQEWEQMMRVLEAMKPAILEQLTNPADTV